MPEFSSQQTNKITYIHGQRQLSHDQVIAEQPLQIKLSFYQQASLTSNNSPQSRETERKNNAKQTLNAVQSCSRIFSITMRTPGEDKQLILGLLLSEGIISHINDIESIAIEVTESTSGLNQENSWEVKLAKGIKVNLSSLERYQMTYSSCGLCGTTSLKSLELKSPPPSPTTKHWLNANTLGNWPSIMKAQQQLFNTTGGSHAAALFNEHGKLLLLKEDIGRHNAVDKLLGACLQDQFIQRSDNQLAIVVSSRVSFEIVQKSVMAGIGVLIAVGAVSNLAILAAKRFDLTLIGFTSSESFNLYHGEWRVLPSSKG
ncbi:formate dehydrogenase accessory sulfurtransferase FdhD [Colwellia sp. 1_MG-2023]|uniref:formate dehydrogenase accessory sulfurtransferase FdhD n=1 Tax=Colwellia sp. 1_MG-2023 TaxID=3062649 RepID=UPI0026E33C96|nr:formate dehydrogenase accessory sulfurtransferase FdhD [Colwellia sp. 1_MG-2023]MDO6446834.1 formate dehydrogenase accessory sulfurtransferase FdhD [Colwellia sp. 1_MG-2023]